MPDDILYELISRCALWDQTALKTLYERTSPYLNRGAFNILRSEDASNDVLRDSFIHLWQNADRYRPDLARPLTWLSSMVRYRSLDRLAIEKKHSRGRDLDSEIAEIPSNELIDEDLIGNEQRQGFRDYLETLHKRGKSVIELAYLHGYS